MEAVRLKLIEVLDLLAPVRKVLEEKEYRPTLEANETEHTVTLTLVVHTKWLTTEPRPKSPTS